MGRSVAPPRAAALILNFHGLRIVGQILAGERPHKDLKMAFDWENTPEGHAYWSRVRQADALSGEARMKLSRAFSAADQVSRVPGDSEFVLNY